MSLKNAVIFSLLGAAAARDMPAKGGRSLLQVDESFFSGPHHFGGDAVCLDGTPGGYYLHEGTTNEVIVFFQGTQFCTSEADCSAKALTTQGSSGAWPEGADWADRYHATSLLEDPLHAGAFVFFVNGCDGSAFTSTAGRQANGLHYNGRANLDATIAEIAKRVDQGLPGKGHIGNLIIAGDSSAHSGALNADYIVDQLSKRAYIANAVAWADGGFVPAGQASALDAVSGIFEAWGSASSVNADCAMHNHGEEWKCLLVAEAGHFFSTRTFFSGSKWDVFIPYHQPEHHSAGWGDCVNNPLFDGPACADGYAARQATADTIAPKTLDIMMFAKANHGFYFGNCIAHAWSGVSGLVGLRYSNTHVNQLTLGEAFNNFVDNTKGSHFNVDHSSGFVPSGTNYCDSEPAADGGRVDAHTHDPYNHFMPGMGPMGMHHK